MSSRTICFHLRVHDQRIIVNNSFLGWFLYHNLSLNNIQLLILATNFCPIDKQNPFERNSLNLFIFCLKQNSWANKSRNTQKWNPPSEKWKRNKFLYLEIYGCCCVWLICNWWLPLIKCIESPLALPFLPEMKWRKPWWYGTEKRRTIGTNTLCILHLMISQKMDHH